MILRASHFPTPPGTQQGSNTIMSSRRGSGAKLAVSRQCGTAVNKRRLSGVIRDPLVLLIGLTLAPALAWGLTWYGVMTSAQWDSVSHAGWGEPRVQGDSVLVKPTVQAADSLRQAVEGDTTLTVLTGDQAQALARSWDSPPVIVVPQPEPDTLEVPDE